MLKIMTRHIEPSRHVNTSKPYLSYGLGVLSGTALAVVYLFLAIRLITALVYSLQEPPPAESLPVFADETDFADDTLDLPDMDAYAEAETVNALLQAYLGDDLKSADIDSMGLLTVNLNTHIDPVTLTEEQADMVHGSYLDEASRRENYVRMGIIMYLVYGHATAADVTAIRIQLAVSAADPNGQALTVYDLAQGNLTRDVAQRIDWKTITADEFIRLIHQ